jgi:oligogalacturonide lyase
MLALTAFSQTQGSGAPAQTQTPPISWIDKTTGHRITRLTNQPGSRGLYFTDTAFTPDGTMVYTVQRSIYLYDFHSKTSRLLVNGPVNGIVVSKSQQLVYFTLVADQNLYAADVQSGALKAIAKLPPRASISTSNADDTLLAGSYIEGSGPNYSEIVLPPQVRPSNAARLSQRIDSKLPMVLFTLDLHSGAVKSILHSTDWLNHVQFSPTDSSLLMYCHEGQWYDVDRIWTIRADGTKNHLIHEKKQRMEIAGHEFWDTDGKTIWYDLQGQKGKEFFLASYNVETGERHRYEMDKDQWSLHFNGDLKSGLFCGDGGGPTQVAKASDGQWIELYHPLLSNSGSGNAESSFVYGIMQSDRLVDLSQHVYREVEPNVRFSPDHKLVIFNSNMFGANYVFAVEVKAANGKNATASTMHRFTPSTTAKTPDPSATIQVVDHTGAPLANVLVLFKSLDNEHPAETYSTGHDGKIAPININNPGGMFRITIMCPNGACGNTYREMLAAQLSGNVVIQANVNSTTVQSSTTNATKTAITIQDVNHKPRANILFLVRTVDAATEVWYTADKSGSANVNLPADPSIVIVPYRGIAYKYVAASACSPSVFSTDSDATQCLQLGDSTVITLPQ